MIASFSCDGCLHSKAAHDINGCTALDVDGLQCACEVPR